MSKSLIQIFKSSQFGEVRTIVINGEPYFASTETAKVFGYASPRDAISKHCKGVVRRDVGVQTGMKSDGTPAYQTVRINFIPIGDVIRLATHSQLPAAEKIESWIFDEVVPTVLKTGAYITDRADPAALREKANEISKIPDITGIVQYLIPAYEAAGMKPQFRLLALRQLYQKANLDIPVGDMTFDKELFDTEQIAAKLGVYSINGKPHGQAALAIIRQVEVLPEERELVPYTRNGHSGTTYQYTKNVTEKARKWLMENGYPASIESTTSKAKRTYSVAYKTVGVRV